VSKSHVPPTHTHTRVSSHSSQTGQALPVKPSAGLYPKELWVIHSIPSKAALHPGLLTTSLSTPQQHRPGTPSPLKTPAMTS
jgi:hypothetical protein